MPVQDMKRVFKQCFKFFIPLFSKIVIKVGKPVQPPQSSSRDDLNSVTMHLQDKINNLIG